MTANESLGAGAFVISLKLNLSQYPQPGTFLHIKPWSEGSDPLLRRAFSIYDYDESTDIADVLYKVVGRGSQLLSRVTPGEVIDVLGPLGNGFPLPRRDDHLILVAGGVGLPPLHLLAKWCLKQGFSVRQITFLCGFTSEKERRMAERLERMPVELHFSTDDGSLGFHGFVTELLKDRLNGGLGAQNPLICSCGPDAMLKVVQAIARERKLRCLLSLESIMPCGVGTCLGCVVKQEGEERYVRVCREGPVFDAAEVEL